jgi:hypothetical protein
MDNNLKNYSRADLRFLDGVNERIGDRTYNFRDDPPPIVPRGDFERWLSRRWGTVVAIGAIATAVTVGSMWGLGHISYLEKVTQQGIPPRCIVGQTYHGTVTQVTSESGQIQLQNKSGKNIQFGNVDVGVMSMDQGSDIPNCSFIVPLSQAAALLDGQKHTIAMEAAEFQEVTAEYGANPWQQVTSEVAEPYEYMQPVPTP